MGRNTARGNKAYKQIRVSGGSKDEAKIASQKATEMYHSQVKKHQFRNSDDYDDDKHDFDSSFNNNGTNWHTANDL